MYGYNLHFEARLKVICGGWKCTAGSDGITITGADNVTVLFVPITNYVLEDRVFLEDKDTQKTQCMNLTASWTGVMQAAAGKSCADLRGRHTEDHKSLFARVRLDLGEASDSAYTDDLLYAYAKGARSAYLGAMYF